MPIVIQLCFHVLKISDFSVAKTLLCFPIWYSLAIVFPCIQRSFFCRLTDDKNSEKFFRVFYDRMKSAQQEIKATVTVNTSDLGNKRRDDDNQDKDIPARKKGLILNFLIRSRYCCWIVCFGNYDSFVSQFCFSAWFNYGDDRRCERAVIRGLFCHQKSYKFIPTWSWPRGPLFLSRWAAQRRSQGPGGKNELCGSYHAADSSLLAATLWEPQPRPAGRTHGVSDRF